MKKQHDDDQNKKDGWETPTIGGQPHDQSVLWCCLALRTLLGAFQNAFKLQYSSV